MATDDKTPGEPFSLEEYFARAGATRCDNCFFFVATMPDEAEAAGLPAGAGQCRANPPGVGTQTVKHPLTGAVTTMLVALYPPTPGESRCRHWQRDARSAVDHMSEQLERLIDTLRATGPADESGLA